MVLDELDRELLRLLQEDGRRSYRTLAGMAGSTVPTVSARIRRMEDLNVIKGFTVVLDNSARSATVPAGLAVPCHQCGQETTAPVESTLGGRRHAFCCPTCREAFTARFNRLRQA